MSGDKLPVLKISNASAIERTKRRKRRLEDNYGMPVLTIKTCQIDKMLKNDDEMAQFFENYRFRNALKPRDGFFGGKHIHSLL